MDGRYGGLECEGAVKTIPYDRYRADAKRWHFLAVMEI